MADKSEKDYLALARAKASTPSRRKTYRKLSIYGRNKKGKTRLNLTAGRDNMLIIDPEEGTELMKQIDPFVWPIERWEDMQEVYGALRTGKLSPNHIVQGESSTPFTWCSPDGMTRINNMALKYVMKIQEERDLDRQPGFVDRRDYGKSGEMMKQMILNFCSLKMHVCFTSQEKMISQQNSFDDDEDSVTTEDKENSAYYVLNLPDAVRGTLNSQSDVTGRLYVVTIEGKAGPVKQRRLQIGLHDKYDTGFRSDFSLPDIVKRPTLPKLVALMETGE